jgi:site-specific DNA-cytosine methylase
MIFNQMKVLIACEFSGIVRDAFIRKGHNAISCDLLPSEIEGPHIVGDVLEVLNDNWDLMIAHPPCTHLSVSGARHFDLKRLKQYYALEFVKKLLNASIPKICLENPVGIISTHIKAPSQVIYPYYFGHGERKRTCLWLKGLPALNATNMVDGREEVIHWMGPNVDRSKERSRTYPGIANAMAAQWG